jgi:hypothetical protein
VGLGWCYGYEYSRSGPGHKIKIAPYGDDLTDEFGEELSTTYEKGPYLWRRVLKLVSESDHWTRGIDEDYLEESETSYWFDRTKVEGVPQELVNLFTAVANRIEGYQEITRFITRCSDDRVQSILVKCPAKLWGPYQQISDQDTIEQLIEVSKVYNVISEMGYGMGGGSRRLFPRIRQLMPLNLSLKDLIIRGQRIQAELEDTYDYLSEYFIRLKSQGPISQSEAVSLVMHNRKTLKDMFRRLRQEFGITSFSDATVEKIEPSLTIHLGSSNQFNKENQ